MVDMSSQKFFELVSKGEYVYFSRSLDHLGENISNILDADLTPNENLLDVETSINIWLGSKNTTARCHYDSAPNLFVQIKGRKKFILFPPTDWLNLYMFPHIHPALRQTQLNPENPDYVQFPNFQKTHPIQVIINPGELLYLPAFWFHQVQALDDFVSSVNIYHYGKDRTIIPIIIEILEDLPWLQIHAVQKYRMGYLFIRHTITEVLNIKDPNSFIKDLLVSRYSHFHQDPFMTYSYETFALHKSPLDILLQSIGLKGKFYCNYELTYAIDSELMMALTPDVSKVSNIFKEISTDVKSMILADMLETLASKIVGPENVANYLNDCFSE